MLGTDGWQVNDGLDTAMQNIGVEKMELFLSVITLT